MVLAATAEPSESHGFKVLSLEGVCKLLFPTSLLLDLDRVLDGFCKSKEILRGSACPKNMCCCCSAPQRPCCSIPQGWIHAQR